VRHVYRVVHFLDSAAIACRNYRILIWVIGFVAVCTVVFAFSVYPFHLDKRIYQTEMTEFNYSLDTKWVNVYVPPALTY
jgi:hypothetical protein